jgi:hypothetical protein
VVDAVLDVWTFGLAPASLLAPMASMVLVWNVVTSPCLVGEKITKRGMTGTLIIISGSICATIFSQHDTPSYTLGTYNEHRCVGWCWMVLDGAGWCGVWMVWSLDGVESGWCGWCGGLLFFLNIVAAYCVLTFFLSFFFVVCQPILVNGGLLPKSLSTKYALSVFL